MPKTSLFLFSFSFILGLFFRVIIDLNLPSFLLLILLFLLFLNFKSHNFKKILISIFIFIFCLFYSFSSQVKDIEAENKLELKRQDINTWVCQEASSNFKRQSLVLCLIDKERKKPIKIISWWPLYPQFNYGDKLKINCQLSLPEKIDDFNYPKYLASQGIYYTCSFPSLLEKKEKFKANKFKYFISSLKSNIAKLVKRNLPEPNAGLVLAISLGDRQKMSESLEENFRISGISHLTAVSGTHINLIALLLLFMFIFLGIKKKSVYLPLIFVLAFYVILAGARVSAFRAFIMSSLAIIAWRNKRLIHPLSILSFCAAITLAINHRSLLDIAWQLSFMAVLAIFLFMPFFIDLNERLLKLFFFNLRQYIRPFLLAFFLSLSVQIMIWPILVWHFNYISLLSVLTNVLVFPMFTLLMFLLFPTIIISSILKSLAWYLFSPIYFLSNYLIWVADFMSSFSTLYIKIESLTWSFLAIYYIVVFLIYRQIKNKA